MSADRRSGFTLLEVMVSVALALALTTMAMVAFFSIRKLVTRAEARLAMHASAQTLYGALNRSLNVTQQSCAFVLCTTAAPNDEVTLVFMRGKEDTYDFDWGVNSYAGQDYKSTMNSDLLWEKWTWKGSTSTLYSATNTWVRKFSAKSGFTRGGVNYAGQNFDIVPQPRRTLDASSQFSWQATLNDNMYFPTAVGSTNPTSLAHVMDMGDLQDLDYKLAPALTNVTAFSVEIVTHDETVITANGIPGSTVNSSRVLNGVWLDGRLADRWTTAQDFSVSDAAKRPKILRVRYTQLDKQTKLTQTFSLSFRLPGMAPRL